MQIELRYYQQQAIDKLIWAQQLTGNDLVCLPTGSGKSLVIADLARKLNEPILILQPSKEILEQNLAKLSNYVDRDEIGVYSASMNEKIVKFYTFATIQSIYKKPEEFSHFNTVIIDECHLVNPKNLEGMFTTFLKEIGNPKVIGLTATPYRMDSFYRRTGYGKFDIETVTTVKLINRLRQHFWSRIIFNINNADLVEKGYLCPLRYIDASVVNQEELALNKSKSDFDLIKFEEVIQSKQNDIKRAIKYGENHSKSVLVFCSSVGQAEKLQREFVGSEIVTSKTPKKERERVIEGFKNGLIKTVFNVGVLTTGFDHPSLDCIILLRPTKSIGLYYQMLGRGVRKSPGKTYCTVIDLTSTVKNIGEIESIRLEKVDGKWELLSSVGSWHNKELYRYTVQKKELKQPSLIEDWKKV
jgi:DNA repair protein RadD